jgi:hypothetical protein
VSVNAQLSCPTPLSVSWGYVETDPSLLRLDLQSTSPDSHPESLGMNFLECQVIHSDISCTHKKPIPCKGKPGAIPGRGAATHYREHSALWPCPILPEHQRLSPPREWKGGRHCYTHTYLSLSLIHTNTPVHTTYHTQTAHCRCMHHMLTHYVLL